MSKALPHAGAVLAALALASSPWAQDAARERERDVLAVLRKAKEQGASWFSNTTFERSRNAFGSPIVRPLIPISCGNSHLGYFDAERARRLALELFRAYGWTPYADQRIHEGGVATLLDGYDGNAKLGFELRGPTSVPDYAPSGGIEVEDDVSALSAEELERLAADGIRLHVADHLDYPLMDRDQFTPTLAYLAGVIEFLDAVTEGPGVDLRAVLQERVQRFPFPAELSLPPEVNVEVLKHEGRIEGLRLTATASVEVRLSIEASTRVETQTWRLRRMEWAEVDAALPTLGRPTVLSLWTSAGGGIVRVPTRVRQQGPDPLEVESAGGTVFLPSTFDARRPFTVTLTLSPGETWIAPFVLVGAAE